MTSDAKIGLLLGLVFIFVIAFIINGLPSFHRNKDNNELTTTMVRSHTQKPGIGAKERVFIERAQRIKEHSFDQVQTPPRNNEDIRLTMQLPKTTLAANNGHENRPAVPTPAPLAAEKKELPLEEKGPAATKEQPPKVQTSKATLARVYTVTDGDNLASIAQKIYGAEYGNKIVNVTKIFEANRDRLESPDKIYAGQKILIPPLTLSGKGKNETRKTLRSKIFEAVESIGRRHLPNNRSKQKQKAQYIVQEGDNLWQIAAQQLGDGSRYTEIAKLNADILEDEDTVIAGMRLKMPAR